MVTVPNLFLPDFESEFTDFFHRLGVIERKASVVQLGIADLLLADVLIVQVSVKSEKIAFVVKYYYT